MSNLTTLGTLEEKINKLINSKKELVETVIKEGEANIIKRLDRSELAALFHFSPDNYMVTSTYE